MYLTARRSARPVAAGRPMFASRAADADCPRRHRVRSIASRVVNDVRHERGEYGRVTDDDVRHFASLLGEPNVLTGVHNVGTYNADYLKHVPGKPLKSGIVKRNKSRTATRLFDRQLRTGWPGGGRCLGDSLVYTPLEIVEI